MNDEVRDFIDNIMYVCISVISGVKKLIYKVIYKWVQQELNNYADVKMLKN